jgi:hypothetical protein
LSVDHRSHYVKQAASVAIIAFRREDGSLVEEAMKAMGVREGGVSDTDTHISGKSGDE